MSAYFVVDIEVTDPDRYTEYVKQVPPVVKKYGGRYLVRGGDHEVLEGDWTPRRLVVLEFPSTADARRFYDSADYQPLLELRKSATRSNVVLVEGA